MPTTGPAGAKFECNNGPTGAYQDLGQCTKFGGVGGKTFALLVATHLLSPAAQRTCGLPTNTEIDLEFEYSRATMTNLRALVGPTSEAFSFRATNRGGDAVVMQGCLYAVPGWTNDNAESSTPNMISGVKLWINSIVSVTMGASIEGG